MGPEGGPGRARPRQKEVRAARRPDTSAAAKGTKIRQKLQNYSQKFRLKITISLKLNFPLFNFFSVIGITAFQSGHVRVALSRRRIGIYQRGYFEIGGQLRQAVASR